MFARGGAQRLKQEKKNKLSIDIYGQNYTIVGKVSPNYMRMIASFVDDKMRSIAEGNPRLDSTKLAVLSAVNMADEYFKLKQEYDDLVKLLEEAGS